MHEWRKENKKDFRQRKKKRISKKTGTSAMPVPTLVVTSRRKACMHASRLWRKRARSLDFSRLENVSYTTASNCNHWRTTQISTTCCTQHQACVPIREQQNIKHMSYITARNCHHQKTTKCQTHVVHNSKHFGPHWRTTKRQTHVIHNSTIREQQKCQTHVVHNSKQLSPSEHNKMSYTTVSNCYHQRTTKCQTCHTQQQVTVTSEEQQNVKHMSYTTVRNCHHHRTTKLSKTCTQQQVTVTITEQQNVNMSYTAASNCHHQRTTKHQTNVIHNSK